MSLEFLSFEEQEVSKDHYLFLLNFFLNPDIGSEFATQNSKNVKVLNFLYSRLKKSGLDYPLSQLALNWKKRKGHSALFAHLDGQIAGCLIYQDHQRENLERHIYKFHTEPAFRRQGISTNLSLELMGRSYEQNIDLVRFGKGIDPNVVAIRDKVVASNDNYSHTGNSFVKINR